MPIILSRRPKTSVVFILRLLTVFVCLVLTSVRALAGTDDYPTTWKNAAPDSIIDTWGEYNRECTSFVAFRLSSRNGFSMPWYDNASGWKAHAQNTGYTVDNSPALGAIAWFSYGHVAWVEAINGTSVTLEEYNYSVAYSYNERVVNASDVTNFIHFKDLNSNAAILAAAVPFRRFYNGQYNDHFYTPDQTYQGGGGYYFERNEGGVWTTNVAG